MIVGNDGKNHDAKLACVWGWTEWSQYVVNVFDGVPSNLFLLTIFFSFFLRIVYPLLCTFWNGIFVLILIQIHNSINRKTIILNEKWFFQFSPQNRILISDYLKFKKIIFLNTMEDFISRLKRVHFEHDIGQFKQHLAKLNFLVSIQLIDLFQNLLNRVFKILLNIMMEKILNQMENDAARFIFVYLFVISHQHYFFWLLQDIFSICSSISKVFSFTLIFFFSFLLQKQLKTPGPI